ncbi:MAG: M48 family metallopeptidase [Desulfuromonadales bacterium]
MRDFFQRQDEARRKSRRLVQLFAAAVIVIIVCVFLVTRSLYLVQTAGDAGPHLRSFWDLPFFLAVAAMTLTVILGGSAYKIARLRDGGRRLAEMFGGAPVDPGTKGPQERLLLNVVEEMAIASGMPVPDVYVLERERGINAFAAGFGIDDAVICVTRGALELLDRDELQGVIAHEFSHILNCDTLVNIRLLGWLHGILLISLLGEGMIRGLGRTRTFKGGAFIVLGFALYLVGSLGVFFGKLIKSGVSRQREYLADASAVQFTRHPDGLAGALKKVGGLVGAGRIRHPKVSEASHMYFCNGLRESWTASTTTHPPLFERIIRLEPAFDGVFPAVERLAPPQAPPGRTVRHPPRSSSAGVEAVSGATAAALLASVGEPMRAHADRARQLIDDLPGVVRQAAREPVGACALVYLMLLDRTAEIRRRQVELLKSSAHSGVVAEVEAISGYLPEVTPRLRLPLVELCLPALRRLSGEQYRRFNETIDHLVQADAQLSLFEFVLKTLLQRHLATHYGEPGKRVAQIYGFRGVAWECSTVLSLLALVGHAEASEAEEAFERGGRILHEPKAGLEFIPASDCSLEAMGEALDRLAVASPLIKKKLLAACLECLTHDESIEVEEVEIFRAVADALGCPVPPWLARAAVEEVEGSGHPP